jgi:hypothetical protein
MRAWYLRNHPVCEHCHDAFATEVHHIDGQGTDPERCYDDANLAAVCTKCHHVL